MEKPDCYKCIHRGGVPGSAHSSCNHPTNKLALDNPMAQVTAIFASVGRMAPIVVKNELNVEGDPHGIAHGWFNWPFNFDPVWLKKCDGFSEPVNHAVSGTVSQETNGQNDQG